MNGPRVDRSRAPALPSPVEAKLPAFQRHRLGNGLEVATAELSGLPLVAVRLVVRTGAAADPPPLAGRASLTADLLDEGTTTRSAIEIATMVEGLGAEMTVSADWDQTVIALQALSHRLTPALELMADVVARAAFYEAEFDRKKRERMTSLLEELDEPAILASRAFAAQVYGVEHSYGAAVGGDLPSVRALEQKMLVQFHRDHYRPGSAFLVVVGDVTPARLIPTLERMFEIWAAAPAPPAPALGRPERRATSIQIVDRPGAPQSELRIGHAGPPRTTADYFPLIVLNTILGGSFTSRLNRRLREEKGYTYGVRSSFMFRAGPGPFVVSTAVDTAVTHAAVADVLREIRRIREERVPSDELDRARNYLALGVPCRFETVGAVAEHVAHIMLHDLGDDYYDRYMARVGTVTADQVQAVAARHLDPDNASIVITGDHAAITEPLAGLGEGPVHRVQPVELTGGEAAGTALA